MTQPAVRDGGSGTTMERFERKFAVRPRNLGFATAMLRQVCRRDREYPGGQVTSLYFDTDDLVQYERSGAGDYEKNKVRLRWYDGVVPAGGETDVYVEVKSRRGFASGKRRTRISVPAAVLATAGLYRGVVPYRRLAALLGGMGFPPAQPLRPVIRITYRRFRFNEAQTGVRVSIDDRIRAVVVAPDLGRYDHEIVLPGGVIEVKGPTLELPRTLRRMAFLDTDWSRFSKYGTCLDTHFTRPGSLSRGWPSGRLAEA